MNKCVSVLYTDGWILNIRVAEEHILFFERSTFRRHCSFRYSPWKQKYFALREVEETFRENLLNPILLTVVIYQVGLSVAISMLSDWKFRRSS
jgi:hypothetical protein